MDCGARGPNATPAKTWSKFPGAGGPGGCRPDRLYRSPQNLRETIMFPCRAVGQPENGGPSGRLAIGCQSPTMAVPKGCLAQVLQREARAQAGDPIVAPRRRGARGFGEGAPRLSSSRVFVPVGPISPTWMSRTRRNREKRSSKETDIFRFW